MRTCAYLLSFTLYMIFQIYILNYYIQKELKQNEFILTMFD